MNLGRQRVTSTSGWLAGFAKLLCGGLVRVDVEVFGDGSQFDGDVKVK